MWGLGEEAGRAVQQAAQGSPSWSDLATASCLDPAGRDVQVAGQPVPLGVHLCAFSETTRRPLVARALLAPVPHASSERGWSRSHQQLRQRPTRQQALWPCRPPVAAHASSARRPLGSGAAEGPACRTMWLRSALWRSLRRMRSTTTLLMASFCRVRRPSSAGRHLPQALELDAAAGAAAAHVAAGCRAGAACACVPRGDAGAVGQTVGMPSAGRQWRLVNALNVCAGVCSMTSCMPDSWTESARHDGTGRPHRSAP